MRYEDFNKKPDSDKKQQDKKPEPSNAERMIKHTKDARSYLSKQVQEQFTDMEIAAMEGGQELPERKVEYVSALRQVVAEGYGKYYCSTDKKWKERKGPKQTRQTEAANPAQQAAIAISKKKKQGVAEGRFDEPLTGWHIVYRNSGNPVHATPSFETKEQAQKYLMTKMFANHQDFKVVHTAGVGVAEATGDKKFDAMMGSIKTSTPVPVSGYVAVTYASESQSNQIKGVTYNGKPMPTSIDDPEELTGRIEFTPDRIEQHLIEIGQDNGWDMIDPGHGRGYSELFFDTNANYTSNTQSLLAKNIVNTVTQINNFFNNINNSLQSIGLPGYRVDVWQEIASSTGQKIGDLNQIKKIAVSKIVQAPNDAGEQIGKVILRELPKWEADSELGYTPEDFAWARKVAKIYITKGERAGLKAQAYTRARMSHVSDMIDELLGDAGATKLRTIRDLDEQGVAEMDNRTPQGDRREQRANSPETLKQREKEFQDNLKKTPPEFRKKLRLPEPKDKGVSEGSDLPPKVIEMIKKIAQSSASPEHKKAAIDALVAKYSKKGVAEGEGKTQKYEMMMRNGQVKRFTARDDADAKRIAAGHGAKSVIRMKGNVPGDKIGGQGVVEGSDDIRKKISKFEELALQANKAGDDAKSKMYQQKIQSLKQKMSQGVAEGYTGRETKDGTWRVFKDGKAVAVAGPFKSREEAAAWIKKQKQGVNESTEQSLQKKIQSRRDALGLAREQRRARGQHQQGQREIKLQAEIDNLNDQLRELKKQGVQEGRHFRTAYGYAGGYNEKTGRKYKHPEDIRADREAKKKAKDKEPAKNKNANK